MHPLFRVFSDTTLSSLEIKRIIPTVSDFDITVDQVLRAQGSDPETLRSRKPDLYSMTENAIRDILRLANPQLYFISMPITRKDHISVHLGNAVRLSGETIDRAIRPADAIVAAIVTIGIEVEKRVNEHFKEDPAYALALDTSASYYIDRMGAVLCQAVELFARSTGEKTGIPISPGAKDWDVRTGQPQIFSLLSGFELPVSLNSSGMMTPQKSMSMLVPYGKHMGETGKPCDFCSMSATCKFREVV